VRRHWGTVDALITKFSASQHLKMAALLDDKASAAERPERQRQGDARWNSVTSTWWRCRIKTGRCTAACCLRDSGELDRFVNVKAQEASRLYQSLLSQGPQPPTLMSEREAEERVKAMMFEFPDDTGTAKQDETKALFHEEPLQE
jgi:hypothetical protein